VDVSQGRSRSKTWDDDGPIRSNVGHRWTVEEILAIRRKIGGKARARRYRNLKANDGMTYTQVWAINAARCRWNKIRVKKGQQPWPLIAVRLIDTAGATKTREKRDLEKRRLEYERDSAGTIAETARRRRLAVVGRVANRPQLAPAASVADRTNARRADADEPRSDRPETVIAIQVGNARDGS
jgi:hypothetical protein